jgi:hypothetical protein
MKIQLPNELICCQPKTITDPVRIGCASDGGYIIPRMLLDHCDDLLSCGLGENWSFDQGWRAIKPEAKIHVYDGTVSLKKMKDYLRAPYQEFFPHKATHFRENVGPGHCPFATAIARLKSKRVLLKMDIEGGEFPLIDEILANREIFPGIVIEIHFANFRRQQFVDTVKKLQTEYVLVHLHGNNHTPLSADNSCDCYEFTFLRHDLCTDFTDRPEFYLPGIDVSNVPGIDDYEFYFEKPSSDFSIAVLLPTRGRTHELSASVTSIIERAADTSTIQLIFGFDNDDQTGLDHFASEIQPWLDDRNVSYEAKAFDRMGYEGLNHYYNFLAHEASADWLFIWNDDAVMETQGWDRMVQSYTGQFKVLKVHTHNEHPYSIFPIMPRAWFDQLRQLSRHHMIDAEISQMSYMLDVIEIVDIDVTHNQVELTQSATDTVQPKHRFEGNPTDPRDFHNPIIQRQRDQDCATLAAYLRGQGVSTDFYRAVLQGTQDPWQRLKANDINHQQYQFDVVADTQGQVQAILPDSAGSAS